MSNDDLGSLKGVFIYSVVTGFFLSVLISLRIDVSEEGIAITILQTIATAFHSPSYLVPLLSVAITIIGILKTLYSVKKISNFGLQGYVVAGTGFFGALAIFLSSFAHVSGVLYFGIVLWIAGIIVVERF